MWIVLRVFVDDFYFCYSSFTRDNVFIFMSLSRVISPSLNGFMDVTPDPMVTEDLFCQQQVVSLQEAAKAIKSQRAVTPA